MKHLFLLLSAVVMTVTIARADYDPNYRPKPSAARKKQQPVVKKTSEEPTSVSPDPATLVQPAGKEVVKLERGRCSQGCAAYRVTVYDSGRIQYDGLSGVTVKGPKTASIAPAEVANLLDEIAREGFFSMKDAYDDFILPDMPWVHTTVHFGARTKTVRHYMGDVDVPRWLIYIENRIDEVAGTGQWVY